MKATRNRSNFFIIKENLNLHKYAKIEAFASIFVKYLNHYLINFSTEPSEYKYNKTSPLNASSGLTS